MRALTLSQRLCPGNIPYEVGDFLGDGADGDVYSCLSDKNKVIKFCKLYEFHSWDLRPIHLQYEDIKEVLEYLVLSQEDYIARVYSYGYLGCFERDQIHYLNNKELTRKQKFILYYYVMEKLNPLSEDEKKVFHSTLSHEDRGENKEYDLINLKKIIYEMSEYLSFDKEKVFNFCEGVLNSRLNHRDLHPRNFMKDKFGNFKLIDFDRSCIKENGNVTEFCAKIRPGSF